MSEAVTLTVTVCVASASRGRGSASGRVAAVSGLVSTSRPHRLFCLIISKPRLPTPTKFR